MRICVYLCMCLAEGMGWWWIVAPRRLELGNLPTTNERTNASPRRRRQRSANEIAFRRFDGTRLMNFCRYPRALFFFSKRCVWRLGGAVAVCERTAEILHLEEEEVWQVMVGGDGWFPFRLRHFVKGDDNNAGKSWAVTPGFFILHFHHTHPHPPPDRGNKSLIRDSAIGELL
jgi:hypothetical protein